MNCRPRSASFRQGRRNVPVRLRRGFTLIELMVAMAILTVTIYMAFAGFNYIITMAKTIRTRSDARENLSIVMDLLTKELRETYTPKDVSLDDHIGGLNRYGVRSPRAPSAVAYAAAQSRSLVDTLTGTSPTSPLADGESYAFRDWQSPFWDDRVTDKWLYAPILQFYTYDSEGAKHRITYTLGLPTSGGIPQRYWADTRFQPCVLWYSNEYWNVGSAAWVGTVINQPLTEQVITNFTVTRPVYSDKLIQVVLEAIQRDPGGSTTPVRLVASVTTRQ